MTTPDDNLAAAIDNLDTNLTRKRKTGTTPDDQQQVLIRTPKTDHERWKQAAELTGTSMSEFIRNAANTAATDLLDCTHGIEHRRWYPWAELCLKCGNQLRDGRTWLINPDTIPHTHPNGNPAVHQHPTPTTYT